MAVVKVMKSRGAKDYDYPGAIDTEVKINYYSLSQITCHEKCLRSIRNYNNPLASFKLPYRKIMQQSVFSWFSIFREILKCSSARAFNIEDLEINLYVMMMSSFCDSICLVLSPRESSNTACHGQ